MQKRWISGFVVIVWSLAAASGVAAEKNVAEEILDILRANGQISEAQYVLLLEKARAEKTALPTVAAQKQPSWIDRVTLFGDFRGRYEGFFYDHDPLGNKRDNRHRLRYRARVGLKAKINERVDLTLRLATGSTPTSRNQTAGAEDDFAPDEFNLDLAYVSLHPFSKDTIPLGGRKLDLMFGKMPNLFRSKVGKDLLVWDSDLTPEGVALTFAVDPAEHLGVTLNSGYFIIDENSTNSDPSLWGIQARTVTRLSNGLEAGADLSYYSFRELNRAFFQSRRIVEPVRGQHPRGPLAQPGQLRQFLAPGQRGARELHGQRPLRRPNQREGLRDLRNTSDL
jgi:hypothetical protein